MSKITIAVGAQGGDEGKGKIIDYISSNYDLIIRYQGGDNAGHTVVNNNGVFHMRLIPSGIFNNKSICLIGTGTVVNPDTLISEIKYLKEQGISTDNLVISSKAHLLMPYHIELDKANEKSQNIIDTTKRGIGIAYADKALRDNLRFEDLYDVNSIHRYISNVIPKINNNLKYYNLPLVDSHKLLNKLEYWKVFFQNYIVEPVSFVHDFIDKNKSILFEGQLGLQRDLDFGQYPYVTSSHPSAAYACVTSGVPIWKITNIIGIIRAYPILAGNGPFPTEMDEETASILRGTGKNIDDEYGINTRRPRRIGWPDIPLLKYSHQVNGYTELALCKLDKFDNFSKIKICTSYIINEKEVSYYPSTNKTQNVIPKYIVIDGWKTSTRHIRNISDLPYNAKVFLKIIETSLGVSIRYVGVGPHRFDIAI